MNWVGGVRNRLKLQNDKKQKDYFERRKFQNRIDSASKSPERGKGVNLDLLSIRTINKTHTDGVKSTKASKQMGRRISKVDLSHSQPVTRISNMELPNMSPIKKVSVLQLMDNDKRPQSGEPSVHQPKTQPAFDKWAFPHQRAAPPRAPPPGAAPRERLRAPPDSDTSDDLGPCYPLSVNRLATASRADTSLSSGAYDLSSLGDVSQRTPITSRVRNSQPYPSKYEFSDVEPETPFLPYSKPGPSYSKGMKMTGGDTAMPASRFRHTYGPWTSTPLLEAPLPPRHHSPQPIRKRQFQSLASIEDFQITPLKKYARTATRTQLATLPREPETPLNPLTAALDDVVYNRGHQRIHFQREAISVSTSEDANVYPRLGYDAPAMDDLSPEGADHPLSKQDRLQRQHSHLTLADTGASRAQKRSNRSPMSRKSALERQTPISQCVRACATSVTSASKTPVSQTEQALKTPASQTPTSGCSQPRSTGTKVEISKVRGRTNEPLKTPNVSTKEMNDWLSFLSGGPKRKELMSKEQLVIATTAVASPSTITKPISKPNMALKNDTMMEALLPEEGSLLVADRSFSTPQSHQGHGTFDPPLSMLGELLEETSPVSTLQTIPHKPDTRHMDDNTSNPTQQISPSHSPHSKDQLPEQSDTPQQQEGKSNTPDADSPKEKTSVKPTRGADGVAELMEGEVSSSSCRAVAEAMDNDPLVSSGSVIEISDEEVANEAEKTAHQHSTLTVPTQHSPKIDIGTATSADTVNQSTQTKVQSPLVCHPHSKSIGIQVDSQVTGYTGSEAQVTEDSANERKCTDTKLDHATGANKNQLVQVNTSHLPGQCTKGLQVDYASYLHCKSVQVGSNNSPEQKSIGIQVEALGESCCKEVQVDPAELYNETFPLIKTSCSLTMARSSSQLVGTPDTFTELSDINPHYNKGINASTQYEDVMTAHYNLGVNASTQYEMIPVHFNRGIHGIHASTQYEDVIPACDIHNNTVTQCDATPAAPHADTHPVVTHLGRYAVTGPSSHLITTTTQPPTTHTTTSWRVDGPKLFSSHVTSKVDTSQSQPLDLSTKREALLKLLKEERKRFLAPPRAVRQMHASDSKNDDSENQALSDQSPIMPHGTTSEGSETAEVSNVELRYSGAVTSTGSVANGRSTSLNEMTGGIRNHKSEETEAYEHEENEDILSYEKKCEINENEEGEAIFGDRSVSDKLLKSQKAALFGVCKDLSTTGCTILYKEGRSGGVVSLLPERESPSTSSHPETLDTNSSSAYLDGTTGDAALSGSGHLQQRGGNDHDGPTHLVRQDKDDISQVNDNCLSISSNPYLDMNNDIQDKSIQIKPDCPCTYETCYQANSICPDVEIKRSQTKDGSSEDDGASASIDNKCSRVNVNGPLGSSQDNNSCSRLTNDCSGVNDDSYQANDACPSSNDDCLHGSTNHIEFNDCSQEKSVPSATGDDCLIVKDDTSESEFFSMDSAPASEPEQSVEAEIGSDVTETLGSPPTDEQFQHEEPLKDPPAATVSDSPLTCYQLRSYRRREL